MQFSECESVQVSIRHIFRRVSQLFHQVTYKILTNARPCRRLIEFFWCVSFHLCSKCVWDSCRMTHSAELKTKLGFKSTDRPVFNCLFFFFLTKQSNNKQLKLVTCCYKSLRTQSTCFCLVVMPF